MGMNLTRLDGQQILHGRNRSPEFRAFLRQHGLYQENFSIGLLYLGTEGPAVLLFRCNGNHDQSRDPLHTATTHCSFHVHRASECDESEPPGESTDQYGSFQEALGFFLKTVNAQTADIRRFFPELEQLSLFGNDTPW